MAGLRLSGINSGFDTEAMIQQMLSTYQTKINAQNQKLQKLQWQQEQYRDIISKLSTFKNKYFDILKRDSYLMSPTSFTRLNANIVSKLGKTSPGLKVTTSSGAVAGSHKIKVSQLATAAVTKGSQSASQNFKLDVKKAMADAAPATTATPEDGAEAEPFEYKFSLDVKVGNVAKTIEFSGTNEDELLASLNSELEDAFGTTSSGDAFISASMNDNGEFVFKTSGNAVATVTERTGNFGMTKPSTNVSVDFSSALTGKSTVSVSIINPVTGEPVDRKVDFETVSDTYFDARDTDSSIKDQFLELKKAAYASRNFFLKPSDVTEEMMDKAGFKYTSADAAADYNEKAMIAALDKAYKEEGVKFSYDGSYITAKSGGEELKMTITSLCDATFGLKKGSATSYMDEKTSLADMGIEPNVTKTETVTKTRLEWQKELDENGDEVVNENGGNNWVQVEVQYEEEVTVPVGYSFKINGKEIEIDKDATVADLMKAVNESDAGVTMTYSKLEGAFTITANDKGNGGDIRIDEDDAIMQALGLTAGSGAVHTAGTNSVFTIDGVQVEHNDNVYELDGITYDFSEVDPTDGDEFTVNLSKDYSEIKQALKDFVKDYNQLLDDVYAYTRTTRPRDSKAKSYYEPLTDEQKEEMSEKEIEKWEEKAKEGLLYNDSTVNAVMSKLRLVLYNSVTLDDGSTFGLFSMGIKTMSYLDEDEENGATYGKLKLDESVFDAAFEKNIDAIEKLLTDPNTGVMAQVRNAIDNAIKDTSTSKGSLVRKAGLTIGTTTKDNAITKEMQRIEQRIEQLQKRYNNKEEYWWKVFTNLEKMQAQFNTQQSYLEQFIASGGYFGGTGT